MCRNESLTDALTIVAQLCGGSQALKEGVLHCIAVEQTGKNTFFGRTATLLQSVENLGNLQRILMRVVIVLLVSFCMAQNPQFFMFLHHSVIEIRAAVAQACCISAI